MRLLCKYEIVNTINKKVALLEGMQWSTIELSWVNTLVSNLINVRVGWVGWFKWYEGRKYEL